MKKLSLLAPTLLLLTAISCYRAGVYSYPRPNIVERKVDVKCCLVQTSAFVFSFVDEDTARQTYPPDKRFYYMDGNSWGNLLKVSAEREGRIKEYEEMVK